LKIDYSCVIIYMSCLVWQCWSTSRNWWRLLSVFASFVEKL